MFSDYPKSRNHRKVDLEWVMTRRKAKLEEISSLAHFHPGSEEKNLQEPSAHNYNLNFHI